MRVDIDAAKHFFDKGLHDFCFTRRWFFQQDLALQLVQACNEQCSRTAGRIDDPQISHSLGIGPVDLHATDCEPRQYERRNVIRVKGPVPLSCSENLVIERTSVVVAHL